MRPECEPLPIGCGLDEYDGRRGALDRRPGDSRRADGRRRGLGPGREVVELDGLAVCVCGVGRAAGCRTCAAGDRNLAAARDRGVAHLAEIAAAEAPPLGIDVELAFHYLRDNLHFTLGEQEFAGLRTICPAVCASATSCRRMPCGRSTQLTHLWLHETVTSPRHSRQGRRRRAAHARGRACAARVARSCASLGRAADAVTRRLHPENYRTYNIDRNINYTNVCTAVCDFCAFYRTPKSRRRLRARPRGAARKRSRRRSSSAATRF